MKNRASWVNCTRKRAAFAVLLCLLFGSWWSLASDKPKIVVLTDISGTEPDDQQSMVRLMLYSNQFEILGLISNSSVYGKTRIYPQITRDVINAYGQVRNSLLQHESGYPTVNELLSKVAAGQSTYGMAGVGQGKDSDGSNMIVSVLQAHEGPIWFQAWGGMNTLAQALFKIRASQGQAAADAAAAKVRIFDIAGQDDSVAWIAHNFPVIPVLRSRRQFMGFSRHPYESDTWGGNEACINGSWLDTNIQYNHGPLGSIYPNPKYMVEGDSPSMLFLIDNGLNPEHIPWYGSWGGRFGREKALNPPTRPNINQSAYYDFYMYTGATDEWKSDAPDYFAGPNAPYDNNLFAPVFRWREHFQNDMAARMDWCVKSYAEANHPPVANVMGDLARTAEAGETVHLSAAGSTDPDGNALSYHWYFYRSAGTCDRNITISNSTSADASLVVPNDAADGEEIHIILTVKDNGSPYLVRYKRVVVTVGRNDPNENPPVIDALSAAPTAVTLPAEDTVVVTCSAHDPDGDPLQYAWTSDNGGVFDNPTAPSTQVSFSQKGTYELTCSVHDGYWTTSGTVMVVVDDSRTAADFAASINFQPADAAVPAGYLVDSGEAFGVRGSYLYGWDQTVDRTRDRNRASDQRYDTLNHMEMNVWEIAVPDGTYDVHLVAGDPSWADSINNFDLEGTQLVDPDGKDNYDEFSAVITVTDGRMTLSPASGASNPKICFIDIVGQGPTTNVAPEVDAGSDQTIQLPVDTVVLNATVTDDGLPAPSTVSVYWTQQSGPGSAIFADAAAADTTVQFTQAGTYVLGLTANDGELSSTDTVTITVNEHGGIVDVDVKINFQPADASVPAGYLVDSGAAFGPRGDYEYGWETTVDATRDRNRTADQRYDTLNHLRDHTWEIALPAGTYSVRLVAGDPTYTDSINSFDLEGALLVDPDGNDHFDEYVVTVSVTDGRLTLSPGTDAANAKVSFIEITGQGTAVNATPSVDAGSDQAIVWPTDTVTLSATVTDDGLPEGSTVTTYWTLQSGPGSAMFADATATDTTVQFSQTGTYVLALTASDGELVSDDTVTITVNEEVPGFRAVYQAEDALVSGPTLASTNGGFTGTGYADYANASNDFVEWTVTVPHAGQYALSFRYALGLAASGNRPLSIAVNGSTVAASMDFPGTASWTVWEEASITADLVSGANTVRATAIGASGGNIDALTVSSGSGPVHPTRILILGDSITQGYVGHDTFRRPLWHALRDYGYAVDFVGSSTQPYSGTLPPNPDFDLDHEGHWGWRTDEILAQVGSWAQAADPDVVLIHLGTNDLIQAQSVSSTIAELGDVVQTLRSVNPEVTVLLAQVIPTTRCSVTALNAAIADLGASTSTAVSPVLVVDQLAGFDANADTYDGVHPNASGEAKMAAKWYAALAGVLPLGATD